MNEIVLIKLESDRKNHLKAPPYGILYLASALEKAGFGIKLYHEFASKSSIKTIVDDVLLRKPLLVGFSALTGPSLIPAIQTSKRIKAKSNIPVIWGGLHPTMLPAQTLKSPYIDCVVKGEGEEVIVELAKSLQKGPWNPDYCNRIAGIGYKYQGEMIFTEERPLLEDLDRFEPAWKYLDISKYIFKEKFFYSDGGSILGDKTVAAILTSRGCPWRCAYCYNVSVNHRKFRAHSAEYVIRQVESLKSQHNITALVIEDDNFFSDPKRAMKIAENIKIPWWGGIRADQIAKQGEEFVRKLHETQCVELQIGAESGSQRVLDIMRKDMKVQDVFRAVELCSKYQIRTIFSFMIGIPGEDRSDMVATFDLMDELNDMGDHVVVNGPHIYYPWPGTPLCDLALEKGYDPPKKLEYWNFLPFSTRSHNPPYAEKGIRLIEHYKRLAWRKDVTGLKHPLLLKILINLSKKRWEKRYFKIPLDYYIPRFLLNFLRTLRFKRAADSMYDY